VVVLDRGRLLADGEPQAVMREPEVVAAYLGTHPDA
jgi:branched-chain amino acid transport system ATP-binding protein